MFTEKHCGGTGYFCLLPLIHGMSGRCEAIRSAAAYFDEDQAILVAEDQVNFTKPATKVPFYEFETF